MKDKHDHGFSLIEFLITLATLAIGAYKGLEFLEKQKSDILLVHQNIEMQAITQDIRRLLLNPDHCSASFLGLNPTTPEGQITHLKRVSVVEQKELSSIAYPISQDNSASYGPSRLRIESYALEFINDRQTHFIIKYDQSYAQVSGQPKYKEESFQLYTLLNSNGTINKCSLNPLTEKKRFWNVAGNTLSYQSGHIGLLNPSPQVSLDIQGRIQLIVRENNSECQTDNMGLIELDIKDNRLMFCNSNQWIKF